MAFDITSVLKNVPVPGTGEEQIEYIDLDLIDPDPENFYSLDGLDDLAANIELIGPQQPLRWVMNWMRFFWIWKNGTGQCPC